METILEVNKLICEFMGFKPLTLNEYNTWLQDLSNPYNPILSFSEKPWKVIEKATYDSDWNSLMPVIEKIEKISDKENNYICVDIKSFASMGDRYHQCIIKIHNSKGEVKQTFTANPINLTKIKATYLTVIEFIEWYNDIKK